MLRCACVAWLTQVACRPPAHSAHDWCRVVHANRPRGNAGATSGAVDPRCGRRTGDGRQSLRCGSPASPCHDPRRGGRRWRTPEPGGASRVHTRDTARGVHVRGPTRDSWQARPPDCSRRGSARRRRRRAGPDDDRSSGRGAPGVLRPAGGRITAVAAGGIPGAYGSRPRCGPTAVRCWKRPSPRSAPGRPGPLGRRDTGHRRRGGQRGGAGTAEYTAWPSLR